MAEKLQREAEFRLQSFGQAGFDYVLGSNLSQYIISVALTLW